jgi:hypothetical protein
MRITLFIACFNAAFFPLTGVAMAGTMGTLGQEVAFPTGRPAVASFISTLGAGEMRPGCWSVFCECSSAPLTLVSGLSTIPDIELIRVGGSTVPESTT